MKTKKIWVVGIDRDFVVGINTKPHKINTKFKPISIIPTKPIDESTLESSFCLFQYIPEGALDEFMKLKFSSYHLEYTNNKEKVRKNWLCGVISNYKHLKWLEEREKQLAMMICKLQELDDESFLDVADYLHWGIFKFYKPEIETPINNKILKRIQERNPELLI